MRTYSLDWNCVIDLEEDRVGADAVRRLIGLHRARVINVALLAASASENTRSKSFPGDASLFIAKLSSLSLSDLPIVPMPLISGLSFIDYSIAVGDAEIFEKRKRDLWQALASGVAIDPQHHLVDGQALNDQTIQSEALYKWRNAWCDVMSAYSHIHAERDVFVTRNTKDFQKARKRLAELGMREIQSPSEAADEFMSRAGVVK